MIPSMFKVETSEKAKTSNITASNVSDTEHLIIKALALFIKKKLFINVLGYEFLKEYYLTH